MDRCRIRSSQEHSCKAPNSVNRETDTPYSLQDAHVTLKHNDNVIVICWQIPNDAP